MLWSARLDYKTNLNKIVERSDWQTPVKLNHLCVQPQVPAVWPRRCTMRTTCGRCGGHHDHKQYRSEIIECSNCCDKHKASLKGCNEYLRLPISKQFASGNVSTGKGPSICTKLELKRAKEEQARQGNKECRDWLVKASRLAKVNYNKINGQNNYYNHHENSQCQNTQGHNPVLIDEKVTPKSTPVTENKIHNCVKNSNNVNSRCKQNKQL